MAANPDASKDMDSVVTSQVDGVDGPSGGAGLQDVKYDVEVQLGDLQNDQSSPLGSIKSFDELGL